MTMPAIFQRLIASALAGRDDVGLLQDLCDDLVAHGVPLLRAGIGAEYLHPTVEVRLMRWQRGQGAEVQGFDREPDGTPEDDDWLRSPFHQMLDEGRRFMRLSIEPATVERYSLFDQLAARGGRDYLAFRQPLGLAVAYGETNDVFVSFVSDRAGGFSDADVALLTELQPLMVLAIGSVVNAGVGRNLLETYLGRDAAARVIAGNVVRGRTETMRAVIWYSDLHGFTKLTDTLPPADIVALLNEYAEPVVDAILAAGGEVLKFIGDGVLAIFSGPDALGSRQAAIRAWEQACAATRKVSDARRARDVAVTRPYLALHAGEVLYGNIGGRTRLDFTVLGPAVNEAARIAALCRSLDQDLIISDVFVERCGELRERMVGLGRYALRGVGRPQMLWTLEPRG